MSIIETISVPEIPMPDIELIESDGEPLDTAWHRDEINLLVEQIRYRLGARTDYFVGGNMFIYYGTEEERYQPFLGPDFFFVNNVHHDPYRKYWVVRKEEGRFPDVIVELLSPSTARNDRTTKKDEYEQTFRTPNYYCYDPETQLLEGWRLVKDTYEPLAPDERGWLWCDQLSLWLGKWSGWYQSGVAQWLRFFDEQGVVVPLFAEAEASLKEAERLRADEEKRRADLADEHADAAAKNAVVAVKKAVDEKHRADLADQLVEEAKKNAVDEKRRAEEDRQAAAAEIARLKAMLADQRLAPPAS